MTAIPIKVEWRPVPSETRTPQLDVDLAWLEYQKATIGDEAYQMVLAAFFAGLISWTLNNSPN